MERLLGSSGGGGGLKGNFRRGKPVLRCVWSAANGGLRNGGLSKSEEI